MFKGIYMIKITGKSQLQTPDNMQAMLGISIGVLIISATIIVGAAMQFNRLTLDVIGVFFQMLTLSSMLLASIFLVRIDQRLTKGKRR